MDTISPCGKFEDGAAAANRLLSLFKDLGVDLGGGTSRPSAELKDLFQPIWDTHAMGHPFPSVEGFLSTLMKHEPFSGEIIEVFGLDEVFEVQEDYAPVCNLPHGSGFLAFASWTGDISDGDTWCIDFRGQRVCCLPVAGIESVADARKNAYAEFTDFHYLEAYLRRSAELRGWL